MGHRWREAGRVPVSLVRRVCDCGCRGHRIQLVDEGGHALEFKVPSIGAIANPRTIARAGQAISIGRELVAFWERVKQVVG